MTLVLYHNPRCSKSREALRLLTERGLEPRIVRYLETPLSARELKGILAKLDLGPRDVMRTDEPEYATLGLEDPALSDAVLIRAMIDNPVLIQRPILVSGRRAVIGRPPEKVLEII